MTSRIRQQNFRFGGDYLGQRVFHTTPLAPSHNPIVNAKHICIDATHPGPPYRTGGPLGIDKLSVDFGYTDSIFSQYFALPAQTYTGRFSAPPYFPLNKPSALDFSAWGAIGWNRTYPTRPIANLGVSIIELRDFPRMIRHAWDFMRRWSGPPFAKKGKTLGDAAVASRNGWSNLGGDYLAAQFGWIPVIQDILTIINARKNLDKKLAWLKSKNRSSVRREIELDSGTNSRLELDGAAVFSSLNPGLSSQNYAQATSLDNRQQVVYEHNWRIWYSAKYRIFMPELEAFQPTGAFGLTAFERRLLGIELNAHVIYSAMPWSWLLDWFTNAGDVVQNLVFRQENHVVAEYAYVMCEETHKYHSRGTHKINLGKWTPPTVPPSKRQVATTVTTYTYKGREVANPYGFGITDASLSSYQWSILAALGLTRLR